MRISRGGARRQDGSKQSQAFHGTAGLKSPGLRLRCESVAGAYRLFVLLCLSPCKRLAGASPKHKFFPEPQNGAFFGYWVTADVISESDEVILERCGLLIRCDWCPEKERRRDAETDNPGRRTSCEHTDTGEKAP